MNQALIRIDVDEIRTLYAFNQWATDRILAAVRRLSAAELTSDLRTSHGSVRGTLVHTLWAEWLWFRRWQDESPQQIFDDGDFPDEDAIESRWPSMSEESGEDGPLAVEKGLIANAKKLSLLALGVARGSSARRFHPRGARRNAQCRA